MTDWEKVGEAAAEQTDKELEAGINKLLTINTTELFPEPVDREKVNEMIKAINAKSSYNERAAAFKAIGATLGADLFKVVKAAIFGLVLALLAGTGMARAQSEPIKAIDMNAPLADARIGLAWDMAGEQLGVAYVPVIYIVGSTTGREYATINMGASDVLSTGKAGYLVSIGARMDTIFAKLSETKFAKKYLRFAILPPLQISPTLITSDFKKFTPYLTIATRFGGK